MDGMPLRLYSLDGDFRVIRTVIVKTTSEARATVEKHLEDTGYTNLRTVDDEDYSLRFIADPLVGRKGRNVASLDL